MLKSVCAAAILTGVAATAVGQDTIVYHQGPLILDSLTHRVDLDGDGTEDYWFGGQVLVTLPSPGVPSFLIPFVDTFHFNRNDYLLGPDIYGRILLKPTGYVFGPETVPGEVWGRHDFAGQFVSSVPWSGFTGSPPECFVGVRFLSGGRQHYGWVHFLLPTTVPFSSSSLTVFPVLLDWAYETRPDTAIRAGAVGMNDPPVYLTADFQNPDGTLHGSSFRRSTAAFVLVGDTLRYELTLGGYFGSAHIRGPAPVQARAKPVLDLEQPFVSFPGFTLWFGETRLTRSQVNHLLRGAYYADVDAGAILGRIVPANGGGRPRS